MWLEYSTNSSALRILAVDFTVHRKTANRNSLWKCDYVFIFDVIFGLKLLKFAEQILDVEIIPVVKFTTTTSDNGDNNYLAR